MVDNHLSVRAKPKGKGVVIHHKSHGYRAVSIIYPTWLVQLAAPHMNRLVVIDHKSHGYWAVIYILTDWFD